LRNARPGLHWSHDLAFAGDAVSRPLFVRLHRYAGLAAALLVGVEAITGSLLAFNERLDTALNPRLFLVSSRGPALSPVDLTDRVAREDPRARIVRFTLRAAPGRSAIFEVEPRDRRVELDYNQVFVDPVNGALLGRRLAGRLSLDRQHLMPFLYRLHTSAALSAAWGHALLGAVALALVWQALSGLYLTLPRPRFVVRRWSTLETHRVLGTWAAVLLAVIAITGLGLQLGQPIVRPLVRTLFSMLPAVSETRPVRPSPDADPPVSLGSAIALGEREAAVRGWTEPASSAVYLPGLDVFGIRFHPPSNDDGEWGFGVPVLYVDGHTGARAGEKVPRAGGAADVFVDALYPIHSGLVAGTFGRWVVSLAGLATAALALTGALAWRRRALG